MGKADALSGLEGMNLEADQLIAHLREELGKRPPAAPTSYAAVAKAIYDDRRRRARFFPGDLFSEPSWDILLDLLVAHEEGREVSVSNAGRAADVPTTTALRWVNRLQNEGWIESRPSSDDQRTRFVNLTARAVERLKAWLDDVARRRLFLATLQSPAPGDHAQG